MVAVVLITGEMPKRSEEKMYSGRVVDPAPETNKEVVKSSEVK